MDKSEDDTGQGRKRQLDNEAQHDDELKQLEEMALQMGGIPKRQSLPRTPERKASKRYKSQKQSSPIDKRMVETVIDIINKSINPMQTEHETETDTPAESGDDDVFREDTQTQQMDKNQTQTTGIPQKQTSTGAIPKTRHVTADSKTNQTQQDGNGQGTNRNLIQDIIDARNKIIVATTRYQGNKVQFNKEEQTTVRENLDYLTDVMLSLIYKQGKYDEQERWRVRMEENQTQLMELIRRQGEEIARLKNIITGDKHTTIDENVNRERRTDETTRRQKEQRKEIRQDDRQHRPTNTKSSEQTTRYVQQSTTTDIGTDNDSDWEIL